MCARVLRRDYYPAARCYISFDAAVRSFGASPKRDFLREGPGWYRYFGVVVSSGRLATVTNWDSHHDVEIGLELIQDHILYEADLRDVLSVLGVEFDETRRVQGDFTWK